MFIIKYQITKNSCTGCGACAVSCSRKAIVMEENRLGEVVPKIDKSLCTNCGLCMKICPQNNSPEWIYPKKCFVAWSKNEKDLIYSASGGVGVSFLRAVVKDGGVAYGCDYDEDMSLIHFQVKDVYDLVRSQSSKYSQSMAYDVFKEIEGLLLQNKKVIFIGTPCQVSGLKTYLKKEYFGLISVDLICHGTPPNRYLKEHLSAVIDANKSISKVRFRGEFDQRISVWSNDEIIYQKDRWNDNYFNLFYKNVISRNSCYLCQYAQAKRVSDITIGDFWGLNELLQIQRKSNRPSIILINTDKGQNFFESVKDNLIYEERPVEEGVRGNGRLNSPPGKNYYTHFFQMLYTVFRFETTSRIILTLEKYWSMAKNKLRGGI